MIGAIATLVANSLFPRTDDPSNVAEVLTKFGGNETRTLIASLGALLGFWAIMAGAVGVYRSLSTGAAAAWARVGFYGVVVGTTVATVSLAALLATTDVAVDWVAAGSVIGSVQYTIAASLYAIGAKMFDVVIVVNWLAFILLGIGIVLSDVYPKWLGWVILVLGVALVGIGIPRFFTDPTQAREIVFAVPAGLTSLWALAMGVLITRREIQAMK